MLSPLHPNETARLACLRSLDILDTAPEPRFDDLARIAAEVTGCPRTMISMIDDCRQWFKAKIGVEGDSAPREITICTYAILSDEPLIIPDATRDPRFRDNAFVTAPNGLRFYAGIPILVAGMPVGTLCVVDTRPRRLSPAKIEALAAIARQASELLESRHAEERSAMAERRFATFMDNAPAIAFLKDEEGRMRYLNERFEAVFAASAGELLGRLDSDWLPEEVAASTMAHDRHVRETGETINTLEVVPTADGVVREWSVQKFPVAMEGRAWVGGMAIDVTELHEARRCAHAERDFSEAVLGTVGALVCVLDRGGRFVRFNTECERVIGRTIDEVRGLAYWNVVVPRGERSAARARFREIVASGTLPRNEAAWTTADDEVRLIDWRNTALRDADGAVEFIVATGIDITLRRAQEELIEEQMARLNAASVVLEGRRHELEAANELLKELATTDELTALANRRTFGERLTLELARAERTGEPLSLALLDVDKFKSYNDEFGHPAGDVALRGVARVLTEASRELDLVARYGGEEFVVLMPGASAERALAVAERFRAAIESASWPHRPVTASLGVATLRFGDTGATLVAEADRALYAGKAAGRNRVVHVASMPEEMPAETPRALAA